MDSLNNNDHDPNIHYDILRNDTMEACKELDRKCYTSGCKEKQAHFKDISQDNTYCYFGADFIRARHAALDLPDPIPNLDELVDTYIKDVLLGELLVSRLEAGIIKLIPEATIKYSFVQHLERCISIEVSNLPVAERPRLSKLISTHCRWTSPILSISLL